MYIVLQVSTGLDRCPPVSLVQKSVPGDTEKNLCRILPYAGVIIALRISLYVSFDVLHQRFCGVCYLGRCYV
jgi:hypothetical protein